MDSVFIETGYCAFTGVDMEEKHTMGMIDSMTYCVDALRRENETIEKALCRVETGKVE